MDLLTGIASASIDLKSSRLMADMNVAMLGKTLDMACQQGQALQQMMESAPPPMESQRLLDVYA
ncbi:MAG: YjfB family protein [Clostridia bacterium]|nr:YjfB family protein [Clostridia bacterium]